MDASTLAAAALAIATETSQPAAVEELLLERERLAMDREALRSFLVERHYIHVPGYAQYARDQQLRESDVPYRLEEIPNIPEAPPIVIDYTEMPNTEMPVLAPYRPEEPYLPEAPPVVIDYTEMPVLVPDELEVPPEYAGAAQDGLLGNAPAHVADDAS